MIAVTDLRMIEEIRQYVIDRSEAYKRESDDHYDFWNEHIRYVYKEALNLAKIYHADETIVALGGIRIREYYDDVYTHCTVVDYNIDVKKALREHPEYEHRISVDYVV